MLLVEACFPVAGPGAPRPLSPRRPVADLRFFWLKRYLRRGADRTKQWVEQIVGLRFLEPALAGL